MAADDVDSSESPLTLPVLSYLTAPCQPEMPLTFVETSHADCDHNDDTDELDSDPFEKYGRGQTRLNFTAVVRLVAIRLFASCQDLDQNYGEGKAWSEFYTRNAQEINAIMLQCVKDGNFGKFRQIGRCSLCVNRLIPIAEPFFKESIQKKRKAVVTAPTEDMRLDES